ncbi:hypothetical protein [Chitinophaga ginsengisoli]|uniref:Uncharacterized protein n=1 Tax=Chitinophaga ginsengisoli TaxID=363837 RepID=A0A2P8G9R3_9BACT|nr:hypothetical protein [Chitinophaga ginsengisoli]PSL30706.1 hypothetical protein CLV42_10567 [Chitinophaga ginsengisoli]
MNKARIILSAVALFAVVGGALAFKAARQPGSVYTVSTLAGGATVCTTVPYQITANGNATTFTSYFTSKNPAGVCILPTTRTFYQVID